MYYMLECWGPEGHDKTTIGPLADELDEFSWISGRSFPEPPPTPIVVELEGEPEDVIVSMYSVGVLLLRDDILEAFKDAGVDNYDSYPAEIKNPNTDEILNNYKAVNIIGRVAAANLDESEHVAHGEPVVDVDFDGLVIDEGKTRGLKLFRLAECMTGIVIHDSVQKVILEHGINDLDFVAPENWIG